jgi:hypothetical protein
VTKLALPSLVLCIVLFSLPAASQSNDASPDLAALRAELTQQLAVAEKAKQDSEQQLGKNIDNLRAELQRLSGDAKINSDQIAQTVMLRSDLLKLIQDFKSTSDKAAQIMLDQIDALRSDQVKFLKEAKETSEKATQALRQEVTNSQAKLVTQVDDTLRANTTPSEALAQRVDAMKKDIDDVKKNSDEDRENVSNISPGFALIAALAALVLGPFVAYKLTANQLAAARQHAAAPAARSQAANAAEAEPPLAPTATAEPEQEDLLQRDAPSPPGEPDPHHDANGHPHTAPDPEKV